MELRRLGSTNLLVSPIGIGLAALGRPGYINLGHADDLEHDYNEAAMQAHAHEVLDAAWEGGVRYYDAARSYGKAEQFLGAWLKTRGISTEQATVGSKWGYTYTAGWQVQAEKHEVKEHSLAVLQRQWGESQAQLGQHLDLYQIHSATLESGVLENRAVLDELARLKEGGLAIGLTLSGANQAEVLQRALQIEHQGRLLFDAVQATWNLLEPSAGPALQAARQQGMGVIIKEALANGRLTPRNTDPSFAPQMARLQEEADTLGVGIDAMALGCVLAQPWVDVALSGAATPEQIQSNLEAVQIKPDAGCLERLAALAEPAQQYWQRRNQLDWN